MKTIVINHKMYEIQDDNYCANCMFYRKNNKPHCIDKNVSDVNCIVKGFIYVRKIKFFERIKLWFKKKMK